jgi:hypothetical protein
VREFFIAVVAGLLAFDLAGVAGLPIAQAGPAPDRLGFGLGVYALVLLLLLRRKP